MCECDIYSVLKHENHIFIHFIDFTPTISQPKSVPSTTRMALQKVKGNLERMFDKNLTDLVRGSGTTRTARPSISLSAWRRSSWS